MGPGREDHGHCSPPKMLFTGNNPHYLPLLWFNQTIANAKGCFLRPLGGNSRKGAGAGGAGRGRRWHLPDLSRLQHSFRYLTPGHPDTRTSSFKAHRVVRAVYINRDSSIEAQASLKSAHGERLLLPPLGAASPAAPGFLACPVPRLLPLPGHGHLRTPGLHGAQPSEFTGAGRAAPREERTSDVRFSSGCLAGVGAQPLPL